MSDSSSLILECSASPKCALATEVGTPNRQEKVPFGG